MRYAIVPFGTPANPEEFQKKVQDVDGAAYTQYHPLIYFVSFSGAPGDLAKRLGMLPPEGQEGTPGIVIGADLVSGYGNNDLWRWMDEKR